VHHIHHAVFFSPRHPLSHLFDAVALIAGPIQVGFLRKDFILLMQDKSHVILHLILVPLLHDINVIHLFQLLALQSGQGLARLELKSFHLRKFSFQKALQGEDFFLQPNLLSLLSVELILDVEVDLRDVGYLFFYGN